MSGNKDYSVDTLTKQLKMVIYRRGTLEVLGKLYKAKRVWETSFQDFLFLYPAEAERVCMEPFTGQPPMKGMVLVMKRGWVYWLLGLGGI
jgi:hypothetical protein